MKRAIYVLIIGFILFFACSSPARSKGVQLKTAVDLALNVAKTNFNDDNFQDYRVKRVHFYPELKSPTIYIIDLHPKGFVMVANEKNALPLLGYSESGSYDWYGIPNGLMDLIKGFHNQIMYIREHNLQASDRIIDRWEYFQEGLAKSLESYQSVEPLLATTWNQNRYYNDYCPVDSSVFPSMNYHVPAGCFPVAMAQVLKYYEHPLYGEGENSYLLPDYGEMYANFESPGYNYDEMPAELEAANDEVARLIYHCGVSINTAYGPMGSLAFINDIKNAMINHFYYKDEIELIYRSNFSNEDWISVIKDELDMGRPVIYRGSGTNGGHGWVCDGYDPDGLFHMNWGWGGSFNGYFELSDLHPGGYAFNEGQMAVINMMPLVTGIPEMLEYSLQLFPNPVADKLTIRCLIPDACPERSRGSGYQNQVTGHGSQVTRMELYSISGRLIREIILEGNELDVSDLPEGLYLIRIHDGKEAYTGRFIKK